jgi:hypothetical protein
MLQNSFYEPGSNLTFEQYGMTANDLSPDALMEIMDDAEKFLKSAAKEGVDLSKYLHGDSLGRGLWYARQYKEWDDMGEEDALILSKIGKEYRELDPRMGDNDEICI